MREVSRGAVVLAHQLKVLREHRRVSPEAQPEGSLEGIEVQLQRLPMGLRLPPEPLVLPVQGVPVVGQLLVVLDEGADATRSSCDHVLNKAPQP